MLCSLLWPKPGLMTVFIYSQIQNIDGLWKVVWENTEWANTIRSWLQKESLKGMTLVYFCRKKWNITSKTLQRKQSYRNYWNGILLFLILTQNQMFLYVFSLSICVYIRIHLYVRQRNMRNLTLKDYTTFYFFFS